MIKRIGRGSVRILIASDVAARGIDIPHLDMVINAELPVDSIGYLHRAGRTARMGRRGVVLNLLSDHDVPLYSKVSKVMKYKVPNFKETMVNPPRKTLLPSRMVETRDGKLKKRVNVDPWLKESPANFVSKIYRHDFEIQD